MSLRDRRSDAAVIARSIDDPPAFAPIFDRHVDDVRRFVVRRLGNGRADDVVSEVFRVAYIQRAGFDTTYESARPWLYGIAANLVRRDHRDLARHLAALQRASGRRDTGGDPLIDATARVDAQADGSRLAIALASLNDDERDVLLLIAWEQLSPTEAAAVLGIPAATARTRLRRARLHLRSQLAPEEVDADAY